MAVEGIDVSKWQPALDWVAVARSGILFAFIKASEGTYTDPKFVEHWEGSRGLLLRGAYCFYREDVSIAAQVDTFYRTVAQTGDLGELPPVLDVEREPRTKTLPSWRGVMAWLEQAQTRFGRTPMVYTGPGVVQAIIREYGPPPAELGQYPLWVAHYGVNEPDIPPPWTGWTFWQYTSQGRVPGYDSNIDRDRFNGTLEEFFGFAGMTLDRAAWWRVGRLERLFLGGSAEPPPAQGTPYRVTAAQLRVRKGPGIQYPVVGGLRRGQVVYVDQISDHGQPYAPWGRIGENQWISLQFAERV